MTIPNVVLGELIDPVTFGNAVVDAVNEHETEISDRLPLSGGTVTGELIVDSVASLQSFGIELDVGCYGIAGHAGNPAFSFSLDPTTGMYATAPGRLHFTLAGTDALWLNEYGLYSNRTIYGMDGTSSYPGFSFDSDTATGFYLVASGTAGVAGNLQVDGTITDVNGPVRSFAIADGIDTADVLDRAETATMPVVDDEGVATTDAEVESLTVNEVITALMLKVKQLEERIEALEA